MNMKGYVRNPWSKEHDGIHAREIIRRIEKQASDMCGCYYEIYEMRCIELLLDVLGKLNSEDGEILREEAQRNGHHFSDEDIEAANIAYNELMKELYRFQV